MRTKQITHAKDYNCFTFDGDECVYLLGGKWDNTEPQRITLPFRVKVRWNSKLNRHWLNQNCEGWYDFSACNATVWFERDTDAMTTLMVWG